MPEITQRPKKYRIATPRGIGAMSANPPDLSALAKRIETLGRQFGAQAADGGSEPAAVVTDRLENSRRGLHTLVVEMTDTVKQRVEQEQGDAVRIYEDHEFFHNDGALQSFAKPMNYFPASDSSALSFRVRIVTADGAKVPNVKVALSGGFWVAEEVTDKNGLVSLTLYEETPQSLAKLVVQPPTGFWSRVIDRPQLAVNEITTVTIDPLAQDLDTHQTAGWGAIDMGLTAARTGSAKVRVAVIDSGIGKHPDLKPAGGVDLSPADTEDWANDGSGHGTHVAGMIAAIDNGFGVMGAAKSGVEIFALKIFPEATISKLVKALDWCIDNDIDVVNMSLGGPDGDQGLEDALLDARDAGVLCVAAAGNTATSVMYPAKYDHVLAVSAIGKVGSFPDSSLHAGRVSDLVAGDYFAAKFTCFGPQIDVCAPGVAVISTLPSAKAAGYGAWDGTSMASPHVAGFAARLIQERPELAAMPRGAARVQAVFDAVKQSCVDLGLPPNFQGAGMPTLGAKPTPSTNSQAQVIALIDQALALLRETA